MLETARKGLWQASKAQLESIAKLHTELVIKHEAGCGTFTCGNQSLQRFIKKQLTETKLAEAYQQQLDSAQLSQSADTGVVLTKESLNDNNEAENSESQSVEKPNNKEQSDETKSLAWLWLLLLLPLTLLLIMRKQRA